MKKIVLSLIVVLSLSVGLLAYGSAFTSQESLAVSASVSGMTNYTISGTYWTRTPVVNGNYVISVINTGSTAFSFSVNGETYTIPVNGNRVYTGSSGGDLYLHAWANSSMSGLLGFNSNLTAFLTS